MPYLIDRLCPFSHSHFALFKLMGVKDQKEDTDFASSGFKHIGFHRIFTSPGVLKKSASLESARPQNFCGYHAKV